MNAADFGAVFMVGPKKSWLGMMGIPRSRNRIWSLRPDSFRCPHGISLCDSARHESV